MKLKNDFFESEESSNLLAHDNGIDDSVRMTNPMDSEFYRFTPSVINCTSLRLVNY